MRYSCTHMGNSAHLRVKLFNLLKTHLDLLHVQCPESLQQSAASDRDASRPTDVVTCRSLVRLHRRVITATQRHSCAVLQWRCLVDNALDMEDVSLCDLSRHVFIPRVAATRAVVWRWINNPTIGKFALDVTGSAAFREYRVKF